MEDKKEKPKKVEDKGSLRLIEEGYITVIAGPCAIESWEQLDAIAGLVKKSGLNFLRGGAFKPRTSPYSFQGLEHQGLEFLNEVGRKYGLKTVTEVTEAETVEETAKYVDVLQIGTRNMSNFALLKKVGKVAHEQNKTVILKRGWASTIKEWLLAVEYISSAGDAEVVLCERGIRTFEDATRNTLDLSVVPLIKQLSHLPVIVDPSHATGKWDLVPPMALAAVAAGADGIMVEVHPRPEEALSDGPQALLPMTFAKLMDDLGTLASAVGRTL